MFTLIRSRLLLLLLLCLIGQSSRAFSQAAPPAKLLSFHDALQSKTPPASKSALLVETLGKLQSFYQVSFNYNSDELHGEVGNESVLQLKTKKTLELEKNLALLLHPLGLKFERLTQGTYLIKEKEKAPQKEKAPSPKSRAPLATAALLVKGKVTDPDGEGMPGVSISLKSSGLGTVTNGEGQYSINVPNENDVLVFSFIGYIAQEIKVGGRTVIDVKLEPSASAIDEVVILGFGQKQKKIAQTGSTASITTKELTQSPVANITNALAGRLPGLIAVQRTGEPGRDVSNLYIRGVATLNSTSPLVTIDGVQKDYSAIRTLDPNEIEDITILKDASATALYGVKGANGVIIVTTRRGHEGKPVITFSTQTAIQSPTRLPKFLGSYDFARLSNEAYRNDNPEGTQLPYSEEALEAYRTGSDPLKYPDVDWVKEVLKPSVFTQSNVNISGGAKQVRYFVNIGYTNQGGMYRTEENDQYDPEFKFKRYNFRSNIDINFDENLSLGLNLFGGIENRNYPNVSAANLFGYLTRTPPNAFPVKYPTGYWGIHPTGYTNALERINATGFSQEFNSSLSGMITATRKLNFITQGLSAKVNFSFDGYFNNTFQRTMSVQRAVYNGIGDYNDPTNYTYRGTAQPLSAPSATYNQNRDTWLDLSLSYQRDFGKHAFSGLLLANRQQQVRGGEIPYVSQGLVGRFTYSYDDRYFAEFNAGFNGTDNFSPENRYGFFPAVSAGWVALQDHDVINFLKFRGSFGLTGNDQLTTANRRWLFLSEYQPGGGYSFGDQLSNIPGIQEGPMANPDVSWEKAQRSNVGLDLNLFRGGLLNVKADVFYERREDMLVLPQQIPYMSGVPSSNLPPANFGVTENKGMEVELSHRNQIGQVFYFLNGNVSYARNKILEMDEENQRWPNLSRTGHRIGQQFGLIAIGYFESPEDIITSREQLFGKVIPGDLKYYDVNSDGKIDANDVTAIGKSNIPEIMYGISGGLNWKDLDFSFLFQGAGNFTVIRELEAAYEFYNGGKVRQEHLGRWTPETAQTATYPVLHSDFSANNHQSSTFFQKKADYLRLKNLEVGYTFKSVRFGGPKPITSIRVYATGMNLYTWDKLGGEFDPETAGGRYMAYPQGKIFNFGLSAKF
ncbi:SusC/RagA family TonB-linked outer membrane protein [Rufibacter immobilis]|uniref:SusC/RagA family TonB-linked outer membrane protein n=1 Tax=Rufibacter immobilis TaxID=1348778 RepID=UPI0035EAFAE6